VVNEGRVEPEEDNRNKQRNWVHTQQPEVNTLQLVVEKQRVEPEEGS
jgi:hypothetical protein